MNGDTYFITNVYHPYSSQHSQLAAVIASITKNGLCGPALMYPSRGVRLTGVNHICSIQSRAILVSGIKTWLARSSSNLPSHDGK